MTRRLASVLLALAAAGCAVPGAGPAPATAPRTHDPRVGLRPGFRDAGQAAWNLRLVANVPKPEGFYDPSDPGAFGYANSDLAFQGNYLFQGNYHGFLIYDISNPAQPRLRTAFVCPGGQGDLSVWGTLLFMSVEEARGRVDCGTQGVQDSVSPERFRGVRIFDISDLERPRQVAAVQTCRGSHTHTLVPDPRDPNVMYVYNSGTSYVRSPRELPGCSARRPEEDPNTSLFRIEVIRVPLDAPERATIVNAPRIFADSAGNIAGLWRGGALGPGAQRTSPTQACHDITAYPAFGLAAGACSGNGLLLDIRDPANPVRVDAVSDPNFAYWHSATFSNDAAKVVFSDEWGGGTQPRCRATDPIRWGGDAIFRRNGNRLQVAGYFKMPAAQTELENCVAHNGSLIPVPGRDIMVQAWYQGGVSVVDFTNPERPVEIAYFDRGPLGSTPMLGGYWSVYWYNGYIYGSEIARGLDVFELVPSRYLSANEIAAAKQARLERLNVQSQPRYTWPATAVVVRAYLDQLRRNRGLPAAEIDAIDAALARAETRTGAARRVELAALARRVAALAERAGDPARVRAVVAVVERMAADAALAAR